MKIVGNSFFVWILIISQVIIFSACKSIEPIPPKIKLLEPTISKAKTSSISIPIEVNLENYFSLADKSIPKTFSGGVSSCEGLSYNYELNRDLISFTTIPTGIEYSTSVNYKLDLSYCPKCTDLFDKNGNCIVPRFFGSCGINEPLRRADISFSSNLRLDPNFKLKSTTSLKNLTLVDPCKITLVNYDITSILDKEIRKEVKSIETEIDKQISIIDIKSTCAIAWQQLQNDIPIGNYGYLNFSPNSISLSKLNYDKNKLNFNLGIELFPSLKTEKTEIKAIPLPNLTEFKKKEGFEMTVDLNLSYDSLTSWIGRELNKTAMDIEKRKIIIDSIKCIGADGKRILLGLNFYGFRKGKLFLSAQPILDQDKQELRFSDIQLDIQTKDVLLATAKWLMNDQIVKKVEEKSIFNLKPYLLDAKKEISLSLNQNLDKNIHLQGEVTNLLLNELYPLKNNLFIRSTISGKLKLKID
jgi:hypothetical protein